MALMLFSQMSWRLNGFALLLLRSAKGIWQSVYENVGLSFFLHHPPRDGFPRSALAQSHICVQPARKVAAAPPTNTRVPSEPVRQFLSSGDAGLIVLWISKKIRSSASVMSHVIIILRP